MSAMRKLRRLLGSDDPESCRQAVELAKSLGGDAIPQLLARARVAKVPSDRLYVGTRARVLVRSLPQRVLQVVPGVGTRGAPHALRVTSTLALAASSECRTARKLRRVGELGLSGQVGPRNRISIDLAVLRGFNQLRALYLVEASRLESCEILSELPLERLVLSEVQAHDLSHASLPALRSLEVQSFLPLSSARDRIGPALETLESLQHIVLMSNELIADDLSKLARLPALRTLVARPVDVTSLDVLADTQLQRLELTRAAIRDVSMLPTSLRVLSLYGIESLVEIGPLRRLEHLRRLDLSYTGVRDWRPLLELPNLEKLWVRQTKIAAGLPPELEAKTVHGPWDPG